MFDAVFEFLKAHYPIYFLVFVCGAAMRSQSFYWLGRAGSYLINENEPPHNSFVRWIWSFIHANAGWRGRLIAQLQSEKTRDMTALINRRGLIIIPLSYLTIALQSFIHLAAGLTHMPWKIYTLAAMPGWFIWAGIYTTIGLAVVAKPVTALVVILIVFIAYFGVLRPMRAHHAHTSQA